MERPQIENTVREIIESVMLVNYFDYQSVKCKNLHGDLGCDGLDLVDILMGLEEEFRIVITDEEFPSDTRSIDYQEKTMMDLVQLIEKKVNNG